MRRYAAGATLLGLAAVLASGAAAARTASSRSAFAAPEIIIVYGEPLREPRVIADWAENHKLLLSAAGPTASVLGGPATPAAIVAPAGRPALRLALFWGAAWRSTAASPARLRALRPEQANQQGLFYPATDGAPAHLMVGTISGTVSDSGLAVLRRHGVPVRLPMR
jgi:hypothetical protein